MQFEQLTMKDRVAPLETRQQQLEQEYLGNYNMLVQRQAEGFADESEEVQQFARNMQIIETAHQAVTEQIRDAKKNALGANKDAKVNIDIPVVILEPETETVLTEGVSE